MNTAKIFSVALYERREDGRASLIPVVATSDPEIVRAVVRLVQERMGAPIAPITPPSARRNGNGDAGNAT